MLMTIMMLLVIQLSLRLLLVFSNPNKAWVRGGGVQDIYDMIIAGGMGQHCYPQSPPLQQDSCQPPVFAADVSLMSVAIVGTSLSSTTSDHKQLCGNTMV